MRECFRFSFEGEPEDSAVEGPELEGDRSFKVPDSNLPTKICDPVYDCGRTDIDGLLRSFMT